MLDYRMETFVTLCKTMNYRRTAELLNITQPAVTQQIQYLEDYYGCKLFSYEKRKLLMTAQAKKLLQCVNSQNYQEQKLREEMKETKGYHFSIGTTKTIGEYVLTEQVQHFLEERENRLTIETDNTMHILERLNEGNLDFALIEGYFDANIYEHKLYNKEPFVGFCSKNHPFAGRTIALSELWTETLLLRESGSGTRSILERLLKLNNYSFKDFRRVISIGNFGLLGELVGKNMGITFAYQVAGRKNEQLAEFHVEGWNIEREFHYVFLPNTNAKQYVEIFERYRE